MFFSPDPIRFGPMPAGLLGDRRSDFARGSFRPSAYPTEVAPNMYPNAFSPRSAPRTWTRSVYFDCGPWRFLAPTGDRLGRLLVATVHAPQRFGRQRPRPPQRLAVIIGQLKGISISDVDDAGGSWPPPGLISPVVFSRKMAPRARTWTMPWFSAPIVAKPMWEVPTRSAEVGTSTIGLAADKTHTLNRRALGA